MKPLVCAYCFGVDIFLVCDGVEFDGDYDYGFAITVHVFWNCV